MFHMQVDMWREFPFGLPGLVTVRTWNGFSTLPTLDFIVVPSITEPSYGSNWTQFNKGHFSFWKLLLAWAS